jgi:hypothetical protein
VCIAGRPGTPPAARRTVDDLSQELARVNATVEGLEARAQAVWQQAQAEHSLPAATQLQQVAHCFSARLSQDLYPYRPKLSILLQYWKRPEAAERIDKLMAPLMRCREQVGGDGEAVVASCTDASWAGSWRPFIAAPGAAQSDV